MLNFGWKLDHFEHILTTPNMGNDVVIDASDLLELKILSIVNALLLELVIITFSRTNHKHVVSWWMKK